MTITCPDCASRFKVDEDMVGKKAKCGACQHVFVVPGKTDREELSPTSAAPSPSNVKELAWTSLYLAGIASVLLLFRGGLGGMIATLLLALAVESASLFLTYRGWQDAKRALQLQPDSHLAKTAWLVNSILLGLLALSALLTLYQLVAGPGQGGLPGLGDLMKQIGKQNDVLKSLSP